MADDAVSEIAFWTRPQPDPDNNQDMSISAGQSPGRCPAGHEIPFRRCPFPADTAATIAYPSLMRS